MIIACPACSTRYVVPDSAIGAEGRTVRCAKCRHSWYQEGPELDLAEIGAPTMRQAVTPAAQPPEREVQERPAPPEAAAAPVPSPRAEAAYREEEAAPPPPAYEEAPPTLVETERAPQPAAEYDDVSQFDYEPPFRSRRNPLKFWTAAAVVFALLAAGTIAAVSYWGLPDWVPVSRPTFAVEQPELVLEFPPDQQDRRTLPNGTEFFQANGTVTNVGRETRELPPILIVLRDGRERIVYSWEVAPPQPRISPGESVTINEAVTDVPRSAKFAEIGWKPS